MVSTPSGIIRIPSVVLQPSKSFPSSDNNKWKYSSWNITYTGNNRANIAIAGNAIVG